MSAAVRVAAYPDTTPAPRYPTRALERGFHGRVLLLVEVRPNGTVGDVVVKESSGHELLDEAARRTIRTWHFKPARRGKAAIRSFVEIPVDFRLVD